MAKVLSCRSAGADCDFIARGKTEEEVLKLAKKHGEKVHNMKEFPPEMEQKLKSLIRDE